MRSFLSWSSLELEASKWRKTTQDCFQDVGYSVWSGH